MLTTLIIFMTREKTLLNDMTKYKQVSTLSVARTGHSLRAGHRISTAVADPGFSDGGERTTLPDYYDNEIARSAKIFPIFIEIMCKILIGKRKTEKIGTRQGSNPRLRLTGPMC